MPYLNRKTFWIAVLGVSVTAIVISVWIWRGRNSEPVQATETTEFESRETTSVPKNQASRSFSPDTGNLPIEKKTSGAAEMADLPPLTPKEILEADNVCALDGRKEIVEEYFRNSGFKDGYLAYNDAINGNFDPHFQAHIQKIRLYMLEVKKTGDSLGVAL